MIQIVSYQTTDPSAPTSMRWAAAMVADHRAGSHWLATGPTEAAAREKLEVMWLRQYPVKGVAKKVAESLEDLV